MNQPAHAVVLHRFAIPPERVFAAWFDPVCLGRWMFGPKVRDESVVRLAVDPRIGGKFSFVVDRGGREIEHLGEYLEIERPRLLVFTWATRDNLPESSRVIVEITARDQGCDVKLTHVVGASWSAFVDQAAESWSKMLNALERALS